MPPGDESIVGFGRKITSHPSVAVQCRPSDQGDEPAHERAMHCPTCGRRAKPGDFLCPACETILDATQLTEEPERSREPTLIRALLSPPEPTLRRKIP